MNLVRFFGTIVLLVLLTFSASAQWQINQLSQNFFIDFDSTLVGVNFGRFAGVGFSPTFLSGGLDSDAWLVHGLSSGNLSFGDSVVGGDYGRGVSGGGVSTGGLYAFDVDSSANMDIALGVQPGGTDFTPGYHLLRLINSTGDTAGSFVVSYDIYEFNDQDRSSILEFQWSKDGINFIHEPDLDFISAETAAVNPAWKFTPQNQQINTPIFPGDTLFLKWYSDDFSGSGSRDEIALDDIGIVFYPPVDQPPQVHEVNFNPALPQSGEMVSISATISDDNGVDTAYFLWGLDSLNMVNTIGMTEVAADSFVSGQPIPGQADSAYIYVKVIALDSRQPPQSDTSGVRWIRVLDPLPVAVEGDIIITELMINPALVSDSRGEYIELYNASSKSFDLEGYFLEDGGSDSIKIESSLVIRPREFLVLARDTMAATNGGFKADYEYGGYTLSNLNDEVYLVSPNLDTIDKVEYNGGLVWLGSGAAIVYGGAVHQDNNDPALWSAATSRQPGYIGVVGDLGSPGSEGSEQVVNHLVYVEGAWSEEPDSASGHRRALVRRGETVLFSADASVRWLVVEPLAGVDLAGFVLHVRDSLVLEADSSGYSQLIGEVDGQVVWQSHLRSSSGARWFNISIPLLSSLDSASLNKGGLIRTLAETGGDTGSVNIWTYDAGTANPYTNEGTWIPVSNKQILTKGRGFSMYSGAPYFGSLPQTLSVSGNIENQDVQLNLKNLSGPAQYNFVGNPYPAAIDWDEITADNPGINKTYFIYDDGPDSNWVAYNSVSGPVSGSATSMIAPGQAFFVNANNSAVFDVQRDSRSIQSNPTLFRNVKPPGISIKVTTEDGRQDYTYIGFLYHATDSLDKELDAHKRKNAARFSPSLYSSFHGDDYLYNFLNENFIRKTIPVSLELAVDAEIEVEFELISINSGWSVIWEDKKAGTTQDVRYGAYRFRHHKTDKKREFKLIIDKTGLSREEETSSAISISIGGNRFYAGLSDQDISRVSIYDVSGKELYSSQIDKGRSHYEFDAPGRRGVVIMVFFDHTGKVLWTEKVLLN